MRALFSVATMVAVMFFVVKSNAQEVSSDHESKRSVATDFQVTLQHTTLVVSDFEKSRAFYVEILGFEDMHADWLPEKQMFLSLGDNLELHVGEVPGVVINPSNFNHFAFSVNDLDGYLAYLNSKGVMHSGLGGAQKGFIQKRPDGVRQTFIQDPDGYWVEINDKH